MVDDSELLKQIARQDPAGLRALIAQHGQYLYGVAHALTGNAADAEDLVQETLIAVMGAHFRGESSLRTWLVGILVNRASMFRRSMGRRRKHETASVVKSEPRAEARGPIDTAGSIDAKLDLTAMLESLSPEHREIIVLRELEQMTYEQMAAALHVPRGTIESRLHRAREELRKRFKGY